MIGPDVLPVHGLVDRPECRRDCRNDRPDGYTCLSSGLVGATPNWGVRSHSVGLTTGVGGRVVQRVADVATKGPFMKKWAQGLKQWSMWLVGEGSVPDRRAGLMLGATIAVVALLGVGAAFALQNPAPGRSTAEPCALRLPPPTGPSCATRTERKHRARGQADPQGDQVDHQRPRRSTRLEGGRVPQGDSPGHGRSVEIRFQEDRQGEARQAQGQAARAEGEAEAGSAGRAPRRPLPEARRPSRRWPPRSSLRPLRSLPGTAPPGAPTLVGATSGAEGLRGSPGPRPPMTERPPSPGTTSSSGPFPVPSM